MARPDADLIAREFNNTARALRHACHRALFAIGDSTAPAPAALRTDLEEFIAEYRALWLARARPGGLDDSAGRFQVRLAEYC
jgi:hypothetical protein